MAAKLLAELVDRHAAALTLYARQWCANPEDVVQEAFLKLARERTPPDNPAAWLFRVVRNAAIDATRSARRRQKYESAAATQTASWFEPTEDAAGLDSATVAQALADLPADEREVVVAHLWGGLTFAEIASNLGGSAPTTFRRYHAGIARLREKLRVPCPTKM